MNDNKKRDYARLLQLLTQKDPRLLIGNNWLSTQEIYNRYKDQYDYKSKSSISAMLHFLETNDIVKHRQIKGELDFQWLYIEGKTPNNILK